MNNVNAVKKKFRPFLTVKIVRFHKSAKNALIWYILWGNSNTINKNPIQITILLYWIYNNLILVYKWIINWFLVGIILLHLKQNTELGIKYRRNENTKKFYSNLNGIIVWKYNSKFN